MRKIVILFLFIATFCFFTLESVSAGSWTQNVIFSQAVTLPAVSMGNDGYARIAYLLSGTNELQYIQCTNTACTTYNRTQTGITIGGDIRLIEGADNFTRIITAGSGSGLVLITCTNTACSTNATTVLSGTSADSRSISARYGSDGYLRILVSDVTNQQILLFICSNASCSSKTTTTIYGVSAGYGSFMDLASNDNPIIIYGDLDTNLVYLQCTNGVCTTYNAQTLDTGDVDNEIGPEMLNIELGTDGFARIAYSLDPVLKFIQCSNSTCSSKTITTISAAGRPNNELSLKLTTADLPRISYREFTGSDMKFVSCSNQSCSSATITLVDGASSDSGAYNDLVLGSQNEGYIAFYDGENTYLHFAYEAPDPTPTPTATPTPTPTTVPTATPTPTAGPPGTQDTIIGSTTNTPTCNESDLNESPDLFQITTSKTTATLYFSPISDIRKYYVSYGTNEGAQQYGAEFEYGDPSGVLSYSVNMLSPNQTYYFKVRGGRGCKAGAWGNVMKAKTTLGIAKQVFYKNFLTQVLSAFTNSTANAQTNIVLGVSTKPKFCSYIVELGDSLWSIAQSAYSNGDLYTKLMKLNNLNDTTIHPGQKLKAC